MARAILRVLLPEALCEALEGDLEERYRTRILPERGRLGAWLWYWGQVLTMRYLRLRREAAGLASAARRAHGAGRRSPRGAEIHTREGRMGTTWRTDLKAAWRSLRARPGLAALVVVTLALSIGITTAVFSVVHGVVLRPLPYPEPHRLVNVYQTNEQWLDSPSAQLRAFGARFPLSYPIYEGWRAESRLLEEVGGFAGGQFTTVLDGRPERLSGLRVTPSLFRALGVQPHLGRLPGPAESRRGAEPVVMISHDLWTTRFGGDPGIVGGTIPLNGKQVPVIGVVPEEFYFTSEGHQLWMTFDDELRSRAITTQFMGSVARLAPGATAEAATRELEELQPRIHEGVGQPLPEGRGARVTSRIDEVVGDVSRTLYLLLTAVGMVLAIACANIANLLFVSELGRRREMAVRAALGAGRSRLVLARFLEAGLLATAGGLLGVGLAAAVHGPMVELLPATVPRQSEIALDGGVLAFALAVTLITTFLVGTLPALLASGTDPAEGLREGSARSGADRGVARVGGALVVAEVALAVVLVTAAALLGNSLWRLSNVEPGFDPGSLYSMTLALPEDRYPDGDARQAFGRSLEERLAAIPGVEAVATTSDTPLSGSVASGTVTVERNDGTLEEVNLDMSSVSANYFRVLGIPLRAGRTFTPSDREGSGDVVLVSEGAAAALWPGRSALGERIGRGGSEGEEIRWQTVVGVVADVRHTSLAQEPSPKMYMPLNYGWQSRFDWVLRTATAPAGVVEEAREAVLAVDPTLPVYQSALLSESVARSLAEPRFRTVLLGSLAGLAALLAVLGVSGVMAFFVSGRIPEIGVRLALGASPGKIVARITARGLALSAAGTALGLAVALPASGALEGMLFGVGARDPWTYAGILLGVLGVSAGAAWWPARRAARVDPVEVLNME